MKVISAYDLLLAEPLIGKNQFDLAHLDNLDVVNNVLAELGFDVHKPIHIYAAQHRTLKNETKIGYLFAGEHNLARKHLNGPYSTTADLLIAASLTDKSLFNELHAMGHTSPAYGGGGALDNNIPTREDEQYREEEKHILEQIAQLEEILFHIRGSQFKSDGSVKCAWDYKNPEVVVVKKKRKKKGGAK